MEILLQSYKIKNGVREWLQENFLNITGLALIKPIDANLVESQKSDTKQKNVITEHVCEIEIKGQKSDAKQIYRYNCELSIFNDSVNKTTGQQKNKNLYPKTMYNGKSLIKSQSMPALF